MRVLASSAAALSLLSLATAANVSVNGWYPCGFSRDLVAQFYNGDADVNAIFECAQVRVPLCYDGVCKSDREIDVFVKRLVADDADTAVWMLHGGPGASSAQFELNMVNMYEVLEGTASVYAMDHRGTGRSALLTCEAAQAFTGGSPDGTQLDFSEVANCVKDILFQIENQTVAFSTTSAAKDVALLTSQLNKHESVFVYGSEYGSYVTERLMHLSPGNAKGYILDGVIAETNDSYARVGSQRDGPGRLLAKLCEDNSACSKAYGVNGSLYDSWLATYAALDNATVGENACADLVRGDFEGIEPSTVLRSYFSMVVDDPYQRMLLPAMFQMLGRCNSTDELSLRILLTLSAENSLYELLNDVEDDEKSLDEPVDTVIETSMFLSHLVKSSELWGVPSPKWEDEKAAVDAGVFTTYSTEDYAWHCILSGNKSDPSCGALVELGQQLDPPVDLKTFNYTPFLYKPDALYRKPATIPHGASVLVISGKLDFDTLHANAVKQFEEMKGDNKLLVEFEYGTHLSGVMPTSIDDITFCGPSIIASYIKTGGDVSKTDVSCLDDVPEINFDPQQVQDLLRVMLGGGRKHKQHHMALHKH
ncbi:hypothetical protein Poli38472_014754 [Pythium oligandrum]|uniref:AB hydrolase-1 domain-containing protein n=1 Tax=Pythium oligandrum TaxID=41045 RepID=A0A8K1C254_PYTOL|nr:hypothetical protein Poli38472_014754 [Pythium oligandrum]|eukprot:TMW54983.1 hypothetical protein Poli38472_014754 [Pythium oligandrum]